MVAAVSFTGGKDSILALEIAREQGLDIQLLVTFSPSSTPDFKAHKYDFIRIQSRALSIPHVLCVIQSKSCDYTQAYREKVLLLREQYGITQLITGDILDVNDQFMDKVVDSTGVELVRPLWELPRVQLLQELWKRNIDAIITCVSEKQLVAVPTTVPVPTGAAPSSEVTITDFSQPVNFALMLLGAHITSELYGDVLSKLPMGVDICGEGGEYHTMCLDSPSFSFRIVIPEDAHNKIVGSTEYGLKYLDIDTDGFTTASKSAATS